MRTSLVRLLSWAMSIGALMSVAGSSLSAQTTGKTFGNDVTFVTPPNLRLLSNDSINGKPAFDFFLLVKAKLNGIYDISGGLQNYETFNVGQIDVWGTNNENRFWMDMHQTQIRLRGQRETEAGTLIGYVEGDFWGGNKHFRLRHAWVDFKFIHFGQDWSFFGDKDIWSNVLDWDGPPSGVWRRAPELKFYFDVAEHSRFDIGLGSPSAEVMYSSDIDSTISAASQRMPDVIAAWKQTTSFGHIRATAIFRNLTYTSGTDIRSVPGYGATVSGLIKTSSVLPNTLQFQFVAGAGIGTYLASFGGYNFDAAPNAKGEIETVPTVGGWAAYEHYLSKKWHFNLIGGLSLFRTHEIAAYGIPGPGYTAVDSKISLDMLYGLVNLMFDPVPNLILGIEYNYGYKRSTHTGTITTPTAVVSSIDQSRPAHRISFGMFFDF
ncbi:MAG: hypothetical protein IPH49_12825 [Ignavibacteria bacterium]|nr:hypothetical protein [Ignavibacteria bacterium]